MKLTKSQKEFIKRHGISLDEVFDATDYSQALYRNIMKNRGYIVASGVTKCNQNHDSLRTRSGHCVMCNPASLSFQKRHKNVGDLYVMHSQSTKLIKVGVADSAHERVISLNKQSYGDIKDWKLAYMVRIMNAGYSEEIIHNRLHLHREDRYFSKGGEMILAQEIFSCSIKNAIKEIKLLLETE